MSDGPIDYLCNHFTPKNIKENYVEGEEHERFESIGRAKSLRGYEPREFVEYLDSVGVDKVLVTAIVTWSYREQVLSQHTPFREVGAAARQAPDRIYGLYGINPRRGMEAVAELEEAVRELGFRGAHIHPHGFGIPPSHAYYFPFYAKCQELGVPVVVSMGHTLEFMPIDNGRPIHLDDVALYFPKLQIVCGHTGWPWVEEAIALASKHPNVFLGTSAYAPKYWRPEMVRFLDSRRGRDKVLWGTDWPLVQHAEALKQIGELGIKDESKAALLSGNARRVFGFD
jgi:predicted TIM-barrel fold metal-dependent hydrolase